MTSPIGRYDRVRLITDRHRSSGVPIDTVGYVLEVYPDGGLEVEVSDPVSGETQALLSVRPEDVEPAEELLSRLLDAVRFLAADATAQAEYLVSMTTDAGADELAIEFGRLFRPAVTLLSDSRRDRELMLRLADLDDWLALLRDREDSQFGTPEAVFDSVAWARVRELAGAVVSAYDE